MKIVISIDELFEFVKKAGIDVKISEIEVIDDNGIPMVSIGDNGIRPTIFMIEDIKKGGAE